MEDNQFTAYVADNCTHAKHIVFEDILPKMDVKSASWGDSLTLHATGVLDEIKRNPDIDVVGTFASNVPRQEIIERRRKALLVDLFLTGANAVAEAGKLVNLDMIGNRI